MDYWIDGIAQAFDEIGIVATQEQIKFVADAAEGAHEVYGQVHGYECIPNPIQEENERLKRELRKELDKVLCDICMGKGELVSLGPVHAAISTCWKCRGAGRV